MYVLKTILDLFDGIESLFVEISCSFVSCATRLCILYRRTESGCDWKHSCSDLGRAFEVHHHHGSHGCKDPLLSWEDRADVQPQRSSLTGRKTSLANDISLPIAEEDVNNLLAFVVVDHGCDSGKKPEVDNSRDFCVASMDGIKYDGKGHGISANRVNSGERLRSGRRRRGCIFVG